MPARRRPWWDLPLTVLVALGIVLAITRFAIQPFAIPSTSMEPALRTGDRVLVAKVATGAIERGQVVVFDGAGTFVPVPASAGPLADAARWIAASVGLAPDDGTTFVKRVIGVGGDRVSCCAADGRVVVNGEPLDESGYLLPGDAPSEDPFDVLVPPGMLWVMGDHRSASADSRSHLGDPGGGMVPESRVIGRVVAVAWPPARIGSVPSAPSAPSAPSQPVRP